MSGHTAAQSAIRRAAGRHLPLMKLGLMRSFGLSALGSLVAISTLQAGCSGSESEQKARVPAHAASGGASGLGGDAPVGIGGADEHPPESFLISGCPDAPRYNEAGQELVFCDDFLGDEINRDIWSTEEGMLRNQEEQCYLDRPENIIVEGGVLVIRAIPEAVEDPRCVREWEEGEPTTANYSSASLLTRDVAAFTYGTVEARLRVPAATGAWPAFWMRPQERVHGGWPRSGEIDVMEYVSQDPDLLHGTVHYDFLGHEEDGGSIDLGAPVSDDYHVVSLQWTPMRMDWFVDGTHYHSFDSSRDIQGIFPFDESFYLVLNLAVGGTWPEDPDPTHYPDEFRIDWVRVYQTP